MRIRKITTVAVDQLVEAGGRGKGREERQPASHAAQTTKQRWWGGREGKGETTTTPADTPEQPFMRHAAKVGSPPILWKNSVLLAQKAAL